MERERNGVRVGQRVRDVEGKDLGKVTDLYEWGFGVEKGLPILFRRDTVATYDEVRGVDGDVVTIARNGDALQQLAHGGMPPSWRIPVPRDFPASATPGEARAVFESLAASPRPAPGAGAPAATPPLASAEEREYEETRGQDRPAVPAPPDRAAHV